MAKKPKSQRRKKGGKMTVNDDGIGNGGDALAMEGGGGDAGVGDDLAADFLSEDHTISDSITLTSAGLVNEDDLDDWGDDDGGVVEGGPLEVSTGGDLEQQSRQQGRLMDALIGLDEYASEKRSAHREGKLRRLFRALTQYATGRSGYQSVSEHADDIRSACLHGLRTGPPAEQYAACRVLEATSVMLSGNTSQASHEWCESINAPLRRVVMMSSRAVPVRAAALRALTMSVFMDTASESDDSDSSVTAESLMDLCEAVAAVQYRQQTVAPSLRATALDCWSLLATTIEDVFLAGQDDVQTGRGLGILELLLQCLETTDPHQLALRSAAGECVALIHEARINLGLVDTTNDELGGHAGQDTGGTTAVQAKPRLLERQSSSWEGTQWEELLDTIAVRISELATESGHHMSKKAKKEQRATFREFMSTILENESPQQVVHLRKNSTANQSNPLVLTSWSEIVQLGFLRHCLQGGFQVQLMVNPTLQQIFDIPGHAGLLEGDMSNNDNDKHLLGGNGGNLSQLEKRLFMSKASEAYKSADRKRNRHRDKRQNIKNHFLTVDGEDI